MQKYHHKTYNDSLLSEWNSVIDNSSDSWNYHDMDLCKYIAQQFNAVNRSIIFYNSSSNEPVAICPLFVYFIRSNRAFLPSKKIAESFYESGPAIIDKIGYTKRVDIIRYIAKGLENFVEEEKIDICRIASANLCERLLSPQDSYTNPFHEFRGAWESKSVAYYYLNLSPSLQELKSNLGERPRAMINKLENNTNCQIRKVGINDFDTVYRLFTETVNRVGMKMHPPSDILWWLNYKNAEHYMAFYEEIPVSVIRILKYKNTAYYAAGFSETNKVESQINRYLLWACIVDLKKQGIAHFDVGIEEFNTFGTKEDNIAKFKKSFGGTLRYRFSSFFERKKWLKKFLSRIQHLVSNFI